MTDRKTLTPEAIIDPRMRDARAALHHATKDTASYVTSVDEDYVIEAIVEAWDAAQPHPVERIYVRWSNDGEHIRKWDRKPFAHGEPLDAISAPHPVGEDVEQIIGELRNLATAYDAADEDNGVGTMRKAADMLAALSRSRIAPDDRSLSELVGELAEAPTSGEVPAHSGPVDGLILHARAVAAGRPYSPKPFPTTPDDTAVREALLTDLRHLKSWLAMHHPEQEPVVGRALSALARLKAPSGGGEHPRNLEDGTPCEFVDGYLAPPEGPVTQAAPATRTDPLSADKLAEQAVADLLKGHVFIGRVTKGDLLMAAEAGAKAALLALATERNETLAHTLEAS